MAQCTPWILLALVALPSPWTAAGEEPDLEPAKTLLQGIREQDVRRGAMICAKANNVAAVKLLLGVLRRTKRHAGGALPPAHYRDIVWEALVRITDPYARARIRTELRTNAKQSWVRQWCAELLGIYDDAAFAPALVAATSDRNAGVRRWAARSLGMLRYEPATPALFKLIHKKDIYVRANAIEALARIDPERHVRTFRAALERDPDGGVRCALLGAAAEIYPTRIVEDCTKALRDPDWRPRMQAVDNLARLQTKVAVDRLVRATADARPVVAERAVLALQRMTGKEIREPSGWVTWWAASRESFAFPETTSGTDPEQRKGKGRTVAYGIPLVSDHVAFVLDKSQGMVDMLEATHSTKNKAALDELGRVLAKLHGRLVFNVFLYREDVKSLRKKPLALDPKSRKRALRFVAGEPPRGAKDIWKVLEAVVSDPDLDTAYLLSSGEPDIGLYVHWNRVTRHLRDLNRFHKVVVHTVVYSERKWYRDQLEKIAQATGGRFKWFK